MREWLDPLPPKKFWAINWEDRKTQVACNADGVWINLCRSVDGWERESGEELDLGKHIFARTWVSEGYIASSVCMSKEAAESLICLLIKALDNPEKEDPASPSRVPESSMEKKP